MNNIDEPGSTATDNNPVEQYASPWDDDPFDTSWYEEQQRQRRVEIEETQQLQQAVSDLQKQGYSPKNASDIANGQRQPVPSRSDGAVLFKPGVTYHVIVGGLFGRGQLFEQLKDTLDRDGITVDPYLDNPRAYGARKAEVGATVVYAVMQPNNADAHMLKADGGFHHIELGGARGNAAADVDYVDGQIVFSPPSAWDELTDKEDKVLSALDECGKWITAPALSRRMHDMGMKRGFSSTVVRNALESLVKLGEAEKLRTKYKYISFEN